MEPGDLPCSLNARPPKDGKGSLVVLLLAERARSECARSTRAIEDRPGYPFENEMGKWEVARSGRSISPHPWTEHYIRWMRAVRGPTTVLSRGRNEQAVIVNG